MGKDPAFLFYPNDYIGGTMGMTFEEKGAYMELLMMQFNRGHMTTHMIGQTVGQLWDKIKVKFTKDSKGLWYNVRLEEEQIKRQEFTKSRRNNVLGTNQYSKKEEEEGGHTTKHMNGHMENVNEDVNVSKDKGVYRKFSHLSITDNEVQKLIGAGYTKQQIDSTLDAIENYKKNTNYKSLYLTASSWLRKDRAAADKAPKGTNMGEQYVPIELPKKGAPMPESLRKRFSNIGK